MGHFTSHYVYSLCFLISLQVFVLEKTLLPLWPYVQHPALCLTRWACWLGRRLSRQAAGLLAGAWAGWPGRRLGWPLACWAAPGLVFVVKKGQGGGRRGLDERTGVDIVRRLALHGRHVKVEIADGGGQMKRRVRAGDETKRRDIFFRI
jgi:hypothetical protein